MKRQEPRTAEAVDVLLQRVADGELLRRVAGHEQVSLIPLIPEEKPLTRPVREARQLLVPRDWYAGYLGVRDEFQAPWELRKDLRERVPQALLRDLFRPVWQERPREWEPVETGAGLPDKDQSCRAEVMARVRERRSLPELSLSMDAMRDAQRDWRRLREEPWQPKLRDDAPREYPQLVAGGGFRSSFFG